MADVRFSPGNQSSTAFQVRLVTDSYPEQNETFTVRLAKSAGQEGSGTLNSRINFPTMLPKIATILNGEESISILNTVQFAIIII